MSHEKQQIKHAQMKHVMDGEKMERQAKMPKKKVQKSFDMSGNLVDNVEAVEIEDAIWEDFTDDIQKSIHNGELKAVLDTIKGQI
jgi:hypothetical protein